ncbi:restriction endonuclease subunit S [uncultured Helicobacter sp.]|uniref:restriction endonuclease subunit S n=1 Tax=uncultured Helicobacter sp. TaxID=175537 RepID=UPI0026163578|nr:restriction endonuclease subunit S [uncultured Helicobacter sp.]
MSKVQIVWFKDLERWDVKNFLYSLKSNFPLVKLGKYIIENNTKIKPFESPETEFDILGVNNKEGVYFNETLLGSRIKQPYYQVRSGNIFYNPYRVNVGSIGIVPPEFDLKYTSPAYVVFKTNEMQLLSQYLVFVLKSTWFNVHLRANTKGSVRQNLSFEALCNLQIPLPPLEIQQEIVNKIQNIKDKINALQEEEKRLREEIEAYIYIALGLERKEQREKQKRFVVRFKDLERWDITYNQGINTMIHNATKYSIVKLRDICFINPDVDFKEMVSQNKQISFLPMEAISSNGADFYPKDRMASDYKGFTKFQDNDLLWAKITPCMQNKKSVVVKNLKNGLGFGSTEFFVIRPKNKDEVDINFILHFLRMDSVIENAKLNFKGSAGQQRVPKEFLENLQIPLPPLEIQQEIIDFIESKRDRIKANQSAIQSLQNSMSNELKDLIIA